MTTTQKTIEKQPFTLVVVTAGTGDPSSTRMLADQIAQRVTALAGRRGNEVATRVIDLRELATEISTAIVSELVGPKLRKAIRDQPQPGKRKAAIRVCQPRPEVAA